MVLEQTAHTLQNRKRRFFFKYHRMNQSCLRVSLGMFSLSTAGKSSFLPFFSPSGVSPSTIPFPLALDLPLVRCRERRRVDVVVVGHSPLFKYKPKRRGGQFPVWASRRSWNVHPAQSSRLPRRASIIQFRSLSESPRLVPIRDAPRVRRSKR